MSIFDTGMYHEMLHLSDAKLRTDDGCTFDIHRSILAVKSDHFRAMFCDKRNIEQKEFPIPGMSRECLSSILFYVYTGGITISERNVGDLMIAEHHLSLKDLYLEIKRYIRDNMAEPNCLGILKAAHQIGDKDIFPECFRFIQTRFERVARRRKDELADLPLEILKIILGSRSLYVYGESTVWQAIVDWAQKDVPSRTCFVPQLLLTLATEEVGEELATEILQHEIISENSSVKCLRSSNNFANNLDVFLSFLRGYSNLYAQPFSHRIPLSLHVFSHIDYDSDDDSGTNTLYVTYDENPDLWRKITEVDGTPHFLISIGHNIYIFRSGSTCKNFDLSLMDWVAMEDFIFSSISVASVVAIDSHIYIVGKINDQQTTYGVKVYDTANNRWFNGVPMANICYCASVVIEEKIYLVGNAPGFEGMITQMFDPVTQQWSLLPPPNVNRSKFTLVAYHQQMYLIGGRGIEQRYNLSNVEVFDTATKLWKELPNLPHVYLGIMVAAVFNDQLIVYDFDYDSDSEDSVRWNSATECWEILDKTYTFQYMVFCSVYDADTIRMITKQNRDPKTEMEKSCFV